MSDFEKIRAELARLVRQKDRRRSDWSRNMPCDWAPETVMCPTSGMPFTPAGAWNLIAELLEGGQAFSEVILRTPAGDVAYETKVILQEDFPAVYIKIQLKAGYIWGRSFHNDLRQEARKENRAREPQQERD